LFAGHMGQTGVSRDLPLGGHLPDNNVSKVSDIQVILPINAQAPR